MRRESRLWRLAAASVVLLALGAASPARAEPEVYIRVLNAATSDPVDLVEVRLEDGSPAPRGRLPVLFVHGHNADGDDDPANYRNNWQAPLNGLPSFMATLDSADNAGLGVEDYYIRFRDQDRSIAEDADDIGDAVELILRRHDPAYPETRPTTNVKVVIIAYSKGTISSRLYLKNLDEENRTTGRAYRPVSEFIAIAPPNHGLSTTIFAGTNSLAVKQLYNGFRPQVGLILAGVLGVSPSRCTDSFGEPAALNFISDLNGHVMADSVSIGQNESYPGEAPGSRPDGAPPTAGTLYVNLFADGNRDFVGGMTPLSRPDCDPPDGRRLARNLAPDAVNIEVPEINGNLPATVHENTVHTPKVICLALYAAVHHRSPLGQICGPDTGGLPVIPPPGRAAVMLALDFSGSMSQRACPDCGDTRAEVLKDAVALFVELWKLVGVPSDRLGVAYFRSNVTGGQALPLLDDPANDVSGGVLAETPGGSTAMGGALQRSLDTLRTATDTPVRRVILFTDGMQNVNPMVLTADGNLVIANQSGRPNSNVSPAPTPTVLDTSHGTAVDTIGVGAGDAFVGLLSDIAARTGGHASVTTAPDEDLRLFFIEKLINALRGFSPQLVAYRRGAVAAKGSAEAFAVEGGVRKLVLKVSWKRGNSLGFSVYRDGRDVTSAGRFVDGPFYKFFVVDFPAGGPLDSRGDWELRVKGQAGTPYEAAAIVEGGQVDYDATFAARRPRAGDPLDLVIRFTAGGRPVAGAKVNVTLSSPTAAPGDIIYDIRLKELPAPEPGMNVAERQLLALSQDRKRLAALKPRREQLVLRPNDKGEFRARLGPQVPGVYTALVTMDGDDPRLGRFSRTLTATTVVRFAAAPLKAEDVFTSECNVGGRRYVRLILSPRDAGGRRMGPGLSPDIAVRLSAGRTVGGVQDLGDGSYMVVLQLAPGDDPPVELEAGGGALFSGRLSQLSAWSKR